jgi:Peptidase family M1 domain
MRAATVRAASICGALVLLAGCTSADGPVAAPEPGAGCPVSDRAAPDPDRPVVGLDLRLADDRRTVTGTETVALTPDLPVEELWFRLVPNAPQSAGHRLTVEAVRGDLVTGGGYVDDGAAPGTPGGLYRVDLREPVPAGGTVAVELDLRLRLTDERTPAGFDRLGVEDDVTWWGSGVPLLTWEPGHGWARDPMVEVSGETTAAPAADTTLRVSAPGDLVVLMSGDQAAPREEPGGRRVWESHDPVARDVLVAVGEFDIATVDVGGTRVTAGVLADADTSAEELAETTAETVQELEGRFGPFPYPTLAVPLVSDDSGGEEYSSAILMGNADEDLLVHEVAHMWFYGMVGNSQFRDPWLDEAFASFAESLGPDSHRHGDERDIDGDVGGAMTDFDGEEDYEDRVYSKGAGALEAAREAAGEKAFDAALRCYVDTQAWTIARPADLARALEGLQPALDVLVEAGALDRQDLEAADN